MFKRTKGYLLLTLLVLTGLAGRMHSDTLTVKERHALIAALRSSRQTLHQYRAAIEQARTKKQRTVAQRKLLTAASAALALWERAKIAIHERAIRNDTNSVAPKPAVIVSLERQPNFQGSSFNGADDALKSADHTYAEMIKYVRTTTENPKRYILAVGKDTVDVYQVLRVISMMEGGRN